VDNFSHLYFVVFQPPAVKSQPAERSPAPSSTVACKPPVLLRRDHHLHSQRLVNEKHFVTMAHVNGRPLTKSVPSHLFMLIIVSKLRIKKQGPNMHKPKP